MVVVGMRTVCAACIVFKTYGIAQDVILVVDDFIRRHFEIREPGPDRQIVLLFQFRLEISFQLFIVVQIIFRVLGDRFFRRQVLVILAEIGEDEVILYLFQDLFIGKFGGIGEAQLQVTIGIIRIIQQMIGLIHPDRIEFDIVIGRLLYVGIATGYEHS